MTTLRLNIGAIILVPVLIFAFGIVWWVALLLGLLSVIQLTYTWG